MLTVNDPYTLGMTPETRQTPYPNPANPYPQDWGSAVHGPAWPESRGFGLARAGSGFVKPQAKPEPPLTAWLRLGLAQAAAFEWKNTLKLYIYSTLQCSRCCLYFMSTSLSAVSSLAFSWPFLLGRVDVCVPKKIVSKPDEWSWQCHSIIITSNFILEHRFNTVIVGMREWILYPRICLFLIVWSVIGGWYSGVGGGWEEQTEVPQV